MGKRSALADDRRKAAGSAGREVPAPPRVERGKAESQPADLDRLIHERQRLGIVSALAVNALMQTTDGNLSVHARKLEDAGYITCKKSFEGRMPRTEYALTTTGRRALERYLDHMEAIIRATRAK